MKQGEQFCGSLSQNGVRLKLFVVKTKLGRSSGLPQPIMTNMFCRTKHKTATEDFDSKISDHDVNKPLPAIAIA